MRETKDQKERVAVANNKSYVHSFKERVKAPGNRWTIEEGAVRQKNNYKLNKVENIENKNPFAPSKYEITHEKDEVSKEIKVVIKKREQ